MQSSASSSGIFVLIVALVPGTILGSDGPQTTYGHRAGAPKSIDVPDSTSPVRMQVEPLGGSQQKRKGSILLRVDVENISKEPVWVCVDKWQAPTGIVSFDVYDSDGARVRVLDELHVDFSISEDANLKVLEPGERLSGTMDLNAWSKKYDFKKGSYFILGRYFCPFKGERPMGGRTPKIATGNQVSTPTMITFVK